MPAGPPIQLLTRGVRIRADGLNGNGILTSPIEQDPYTGHRMVRFSGPDGVSIAVVEI